MGIATRHAENESWASATAERMSDSIRTAGSADVDVGSRVVDVGGEEAEVVGAAVAVVVDETATDDADVAEADVPPDVVELDDSELHAAKHTKSKTVPAAFLARRATASRFLAMGLLAVAPDLRSIRP